MRSVSYDLPNDHAERTLLPISDTRCTALLAVLRLQSGSPAANTEEHSSSSSSEAKAVEDKTKEGQKLQPTHKAARAAAAAGVVVGLQLVARSWL